MKHSAYSTYKDSGVGWLGRIPAHWKVNRLKFIARRKDVKLDADEGNHLRYVGLENVESWTGKVVKGEERIPEAVSNLFSADDTLFGKLRPYLAKACNPSFDGLCSSELLVLRSCSQERRFFLYQLLSEGFISLVDSSTYGAKMPRADWEFIGSCVLPSPPRPEQVAIADFLDCKTAEIEALVAKKRALTEKLKEKRAALISRTVIRGLPPDEARAAGFQPNPKMKSYGVEWLGNVPEHWNVTKLGRHIRLLTGYPFNSELFSFIDGIKLVRGDNVTEGELRWGDKTRCWNEPYRDLQEYLLAASDVLIGMDGSKVGKNYALVQTSDLPLLLVQRVARLRTKNTLQTGFLLRLIGSSLFQTWVELVKTDPAVPHISPHDIRDFPLALPPLPEQRAIADFLERETVKIDSLVAKVEQAIERLLEYRTALITAAVTGKIQVSGQRGLGGLDGLGDKALKGVAGGACD
ncbi:MAG TPA: restriction endonuclease subunit S [Terriglobales bacterium]|nr:restriction endonuclease subunit S [Terriglobales bacterium]